MTRICARQMGALLLVAVVCGCGGRSSPGGLKGDAAGHDAVADGHVDGSTGSGSDPKIVTCGSTTCTTTSQFCCIENTGGTVLWQCMANSPASKCGQPRRHCDEAADCTSGQKCCVPVTARAFPAYSTECASSCGDLTYWFQVCKTSAECTGGKSCLSQTCGGYALQACGIADSYFCK